MLPAHRADRLCVFHRNRLAATGVVGDRQHHQRNAITAYAGDEFLEGGDIHVPFERFTHAGLPGFGARKIDGFGADEFDIRTCGVEVRVVGDDVALLASAVKEDAFSRSSLVRWDHMLVAEDVLHGIAKTVEAGTAGIALVPFHDRCPLVRRHGARAGVGEQINKDVARGEEKQIVVSGAQ